MTSTDGKFKVEAGSFPATFYVVIPTIGLPGAKPTDQWQVQGEPYGVFSSSGAGVKNGKLSLMMEKTLPLPELFCWSESGQGKYIEGLQVKGQTLTASIDQLGVCAIGLGMSDAD